MCLSKNLKKEKSLHWVCRIDFRWLLFYTNLHKLFCQFISWTNWENSGKFMDNCWISCQVMADMKKVYDDLIISNLYSFQMQLFKRNNKIKQMCKNVCWLKLRTFVKTKEQKKTFALRKSQILVFKRDKICTKVITVDSAHSFLIQWEKRKFRFWFLFLKEIEFFNLAKNVWKLLIY